MSFKLLCLILFVNGINSFSPNVCPKDVALGIPFDLYGSPIFPVALYDTNRMAPVQVIAYSKISPIVILYCVKHLRPL